LTKTWRNPPKNRGSIRSAEAAPSTPVATATANNKCMRPVPLSVVMARPVPLSVVMARPGPLYVVMARPVRLSIVMARPVRATYVGTQPRLVAPTCLDVTARDVAADSHVVGARLHPARPEIRTHDLLI